MVITTLRIMAPPEKRDEILKTFRSIVGPTRIKPGCISSHVFVDLEDANAFSMVEAHPRFALHNWPSAVGQHREMFAPAVDTFREFLLVCRAPERRGQRPTTLVLRYG